MNFIKWYNDTAILIDGSIINFLPDGKTICHFSKHWKVCGTNINKFADKYQAIKVFQEIEKLIIK